MSTINKGQGDGRITNYTWAVRKRASWLSNDETLMNTWMRTSWWLIFLIDCAHEMCNVQVCTAALQWSFFMLGMFEEVGGATHNTSESCQLPNDQILIWDPNQRQVPGSNIDIYISKWFPDQFPAVMPYSLLTWKIELVWNSLWQGTSSLFVCKKNLYETRGADPGWGWKL